MNLKSIGFGAAIAATAVAGSFATATPSHALSLAPGSFALQAQGGPTVTEVGSGGGSTDTLNLSGLTFNLTSLSGALTGLSAASGGIKLNNPLILTSLGTVSGLELFKNNAVSEFITGLQLGGEAVIFDLGGSGNNASFTRSGFNYTGSSLGGTLRFAATGGSAIAEATIANLSFGGQSETNIQVATVPTPALLPGLIGFGVAALRKRKGETSPEAETETVEVKA
ncbi:PTPA-CTERM sorting domain-containing protein [Cyanobacteria bacterium FACHB-DQ100]|nr:PTPA-CTERM sorting domain-containing protein [Cyanobacteria bacterium FACHB-DQ100]